MPYAEEVLAWAVAQNPGEVEFHQALREVLPALTPILAEHPEFQQWGLLERLVEPERFVTFRVPWIDDAGRVRVNRGYRVQFSSALGPYKGGMRFHPSVNASIVKFLGFEQIFKNSLTGLELGGGKGGSDFDPKGKSEREIMVFCQSFMSELYRHIGPDTDVPAGDIGVGGREVGYLYGQYKRLTDTYVGVFTGKGKSFGGSMLRTQATGYGLVYLMQELLEQRGQGFAGRRVVISGAGNVAIYAAEKAIQLGARVLTMSDSNGWIHDPAGIDIELVKQIKEVERGRISAYREMLPQAAYYTEGSVWSVPCDIALPCATQNELPEQGAAMLIANGCQAVGEGSNMGSTPQAVALLQENGVIFAPGKAANAGGVAVSALEMSQNSQRRSWAFERVEQELQEIMHHICTRICRYAENCGQPQNLVLGANTAAFTKIARAMMRQGVV